MKATLSLPQRPTGLYLVGVLDVLALLLVLFILVPAMNQELGLMVSLPESEFRLARHDHDRLISVTVVGSAHPSVFIGRERVNLDAFSARLEEASEKGGADLVVLRIDEGVSVKVERALIEAALALGLKVGLPGREAGSSEGDPSPLVAPIPTESPNP
jgi:biopolymer transport protein ExbD